MEFQLDPIADDAPPGLKVWLADHMRRVAALLNAPMQATALGGPPARPRNGMIVYAVEPWATTLGAEGFYGFEDGAWVKL